MGMMRRDRIVGSSGGRRGFLHAAALGLLAHAVPSRGVESAGRVVIIGGGFAGGACALALRKLDRALDVALVDPDARYVTGPMSNAVLAVWRTLDSITLSRAGIEHAGVRVIRDRAMSIVAGSRRVRLQGGADLGYDRLVVAPGIRFLWGTPEGYDETAARSMPHAWIAGAQTALLAAQLRAMEPGGVVAISVPSGLIRCPPGPFERATLIAAWLKQNKPRAKVLIFDANNHFPRQDLFMAAWQELYPGMIEWLPSTEGGAVERVDVNKKTLYTSRGAQRVAVANIIPPQAPAQIAVEAGLATGHGWCPVDAATFESNLRRHVHVIGDAGAAGAMPKSASAAHSQALRCAEAVVAALRERDLPAAGLDSVCYSFLADDRALAIHGRFSVEAGEIRAAELPLPTRRPSAREEAQLAANWYRSTLADSFGAGVS
jgi:sulfide dehydrogenase [flavocytochrome c] flavoprotein subunit